MALLLSPVRTDTAAMKFGTHCVPVTPTSNRRSGLRSSGNQQFSSLRWLRRHQKSKAARVIEERSGTSVADDDDVVADDYYSVLGLLPDASQEEIKKAYYNCMKACHPDLSGDTPDTTNFCMFINEVYEVLSDPVQRMVYDEIHGYALTAVNPFFDNTNPKDHVFVDEFSCIGCKNCANLVQDVFKIEEDFGRARACCQSGNPELVQQAIDSCPVDCIHWTSAAQLSLLEDEMRKAERVNVGLMLSGMGGKIDVFAMARSRWEKRQMKVLEKAKIRIMKQQGSGKPGPNWSDLWGSPADFKDGGEKEVQERAKRAAAAARRWREYSRKGADKRPRFNLPGASPDDACN